MMNPGTDPLSAPGGARATPLVSAIVVNFNGRGFVEEAVASLLAQDLDGLEVIVVDNGSSDDSDGEMGRCFDGSIRLLRAGRNLGFGAGNNLGIREARGRYVMLLNNDAVAMDSCARELVALAEADTRVGMVAAKVLEYGRRDVIDTAGHLLYPDGINFGRGRLEIDRGQYDACRTALFPSGSVALYRRAMLDEIGLFDETFFLYGDDTELGLRGRLAGWSCAFAPRAVAFHRGSQTAGRYSRLKAFHVERNRIWVLVRIFPFTIMLANPFFTALRLALSAWAGLTGRGAAGCHAREHSFLSLVTLTLAAHFAALQGIPRMLGQRWRDRRLRRLGTRGFLRLLLAHRVSARDVAFKT
jgi:GT2 family glycosyltransferase